MGRPKLPKEKIKSVFKQVRISPEDQKFMDKFGISPTKLFTDALINKKNKK